METWLKFIKDHNLYNLANPVSLEEIEIAERQLGLSFANDYRKFLQNIGACICSGHEIKGISENVNLNVVIATEEARVSMELLPHSWYVIEDIHMDGILILQDRNGAIYQMSSRESPAKIASSLEDYMKLTTQLPDADTLNELPKQKLVNKTELEKTAQHLLSKNFAKAEEALKKPDQVEKALQQMEKIMEKIPFIGDWIADVPAIISLLRSYIRKEYREIPVASIVAALAAVLYVVSPVDIIPDIVPGAGLLDDAAVFVVCWKMIHDDVDKYQEWRKKLGRT